MLTRAGGGKESVDGGPLGREEKPKGGCPKILLVNFAPQTSAGANANAHV